MIVRAVQQADAPTVQGAVLVIAVLYVVINGAIDMLYGVLDPRSRRAKV